MSWILVSVAVAMVVVLVVLFGNKKERHPEEGHAETERAKPKGGISMVLIMLIIYFLGFLSGIAAWQRVMKDRQHYEQGMEALQEENESRTVPSR